MTLKNAQVQQCKPNSECICNVLVQIASLRFRDCKLMHLCIPYVWIENNMIQKKYMAELYSLNFWQSFGEWYAQLTKGDITKCSEFREGFIVVCNVFVKIVEWSIDSSMSGPKSFNVWAQADKVY